MKGSESLIAKITAKLQDSEEQIIGLQVCMHHLPFIMLIFLDIISSQAVFEFDAVVELIWLSI